MDKTIGKTVQKVMGKGEKVAPVKSIKLKVKFQKAKRKVQSQMGRVKSSFSGK